MNGERTTLREPAALFLRLGATALGGQISTIPSSVHSAVPSRMA